MEDGEISRMVAAAAIAGANLGRQIQNNRVIDSWADYAHDLEDELENVKRQLRIKDLDFEMEKVQVRMRETIVNNLLKSNAEKDHLIQHHKNGFDQMAEVADDLSAYSKSLKEKINTLERAHRSTSGKLAFYEEIYKLLCDEIKASKSAEKYESFNPEFRQAAMDRVWKEFMKTGKVEYTPDLSFVYINESLAKQFTATPLSI
jgi:predicted  nucleic acid-binding Zn-ribbon protein